MTDKNELKILQEILLNLLKKVIEVCEKLNIDYFLTEGNCLGAIRHQGFIPWDDDVDIAIPIESYEKFLKEAPMLLGENYLIRGAFEQEKNPKQTEIMTKVFDVRTKISIDVYEESKVISPWLDVSVICGLPNNKVYRQLYFFFILIRKAFLKMSNRSSIGFNSNKKRSLLEKMILIFLKYVDLSYFFDTKKEAAKLRKLLTRYPIGESEYVVAFESDYRWKEIMPASYYGKGKRVKFEDIMVNVPINSDAYLRKLYGNYMILPPVKERKPKHKVKILF